MSPCPYNWEWFISCAAVQGLNAANINLYSQQLESLLAYHTLPRAYRWAHTRARTSQPQHSHCQGRSVSSFCWL